jgi:hypothetical protein
MARKRHPLEETIGKLRVVEVELAEGQSAQQACRKIGVTAHTSTGGARSTAVCGWTGPSACSNSSARTRG